MTALEIAATAVVVLLVLRDIIKGANMANSIETLTAAVERDTTIKAGAGTFIRGILTELAAVKAELAGQGADVTVLDNLTAKLEAGTNALAAALVTNTTSDPDAPVPDEDDVEDDTEDDVNV